MAILNNQRVQNNMRSSDLHSARSQHPQEGSRTPSNRPESSRTASNLASRVPWNAAFGTWKSHLFGFPKMEATPLSLDGLHGKTQSKMDDLGVTPF